MNKSIALLGIISGIAVAASFFLALYFLLVKKNDRYKNNLLGFMFISIGLRIAKSIAYFIFIDVLSIGLALGYLGLATIGPLLYLYFNSFYTEKIKNAVYYHFIIPFIGIFVCFFTHLGHITLLYKFVTTVLFLYIILSIIKHIHFKYDNCDIKNWNTNLLIVVSVILMSFVSQHLTPVVINYAIGTSIASISIYYIFIYALKSPFIFNRPRHKTISSDVRQKVKLAFEKDRLYLKPKINLTEFSQELNIPAYLVTESVKQLYGKRFPEAINHFRVNEVKVKLIDPNLNNSKIEVLAYEVGFNTPSTFYAAFKKETNLSPKEFQKKNLIHSSNSY